MRPEEAVARLGGTTSRRAVLRLVPVRALERAVADGRVVRSGLGRYSLPSVGAQLVTAHSLSGVASHLSAAQHWGWELKTPPPLPHVTVPRKRRVAPARREGVVVHWTDLHPDDIRAPGVSSPRRTLLDCLTTCPFDEALAVADSALRHRSITSADLRALTDGLGGRGSGTARRVALLADGRAANPFESVLRAIASQTRLALVPQVQVDEFRPDLVDVSRRLILEADSHTWHSSRDALRRDCRRYNALVLRGWTVLRFTWEDVMLHPDRVRADLEWVAQQALPRRSGRNRLTSR